MAAPLDLKALFDAIGDAVVVCDRAGAVIFWNPAAERMFGHTQAEAMGQRMDMIVPERLRKRHWDGYDQSMATGKTKYAHDVLRVPAVDKAGRSLSIAFTVFMLFDDAGQVTACGSVIPRSEAYQGKSPMAANSEVPMANAPRPRARIASFILGCGDMAAPFGRAGKGREVLFAITELPARRHPILKADRPCAARKCRITPASAACACQKRR